MLSSKNGVRTLVSTGVLSSYIESLIKKNQIGKIHSVFPNGFNLNFSGELIFVSYEQTGMLGVHGLSINNDVFDHLLTCLKVGYSVRIRNLEFTFYTHPLTFTVRLEDMLVKNFQLTTLSKKSFEEMNFKNRLQSLDFFSQSGFSDVERLNSILEDIRLQKEITTEHVNQLIGNGVGLTPSGDDFLQGVILMEKTLNYPPHIQNIVRKQLEVRSTTDVSLSYFEALLSGYTSEPIIILLEAIAEKDEMRFEQAVSYIQKFGHTSGFDLLMGILTYLQII